MQLDLNECILFFFFFKSTQLHYSNYQLITIKQNRAHTVQKKKLETLFGSTFSRGTVLEFCQRMFCLFGKEKKKKTKC